MTKKTEKFLPSVPYTKLPTSGQDTLPLVFQEIKKATNIAINKSIKHTTMEATIQSTNRAINIDINVSINADALKAITQRGLQDAWQAIKQSVLIPIKQCLLQAVKQATNKRVNIGALTLPRLYRMVLLMSRAAVRTIDAHPTLSNIALWLIGIGIMVEIFLFA